MSLGMEVAVLFVLAMPIAAISWTLTHEEVLREPRDWCARRSRLGRSWWERKVFYVFTCEYCLSHWVTMGFLVATRFKLLYPGWLGYVVAGFSLVWIANLYMSFFARLRLEIREERLEVEKSELELDKKI